MIPEFTIVPTPPAPPAPPAPVPAAAAIDGRWYYAVPTNGKARPYRTPAAAMMALGVLHADGDLYTECDGVRTLLGHRSATGEWTHYADATAD